MPHLTLAHTSNLSAATASRELFARMHHLLAEVCAVRIDNCKSRTQRLDDYLVGSGETEEGFVHLDVRFLAGRPEEAKAELGRQLLALLTEAYAGVDLPMQITVEVGEIEPDSYFKFPAGTLGP